jgi:hypothetical protein
MLCPSPKRRFRPTTDVSRCNSALEQLKCFLLLLKSIFTLLLADLVSGALNIHFAANDYFEFGVVQFALCLMRSIPQDGGARLSRTVPVLSTRMSSETRHSFYSICISCGRTIRSLVRPNWRNSLAATVTRVTDGTQSRHLVMAVTGPRGSANVSCGSIAPI